MKECELCQAPARMFCESDRASLCWDCDEKVHCANFLVARHSRILLCHSCRSPTPWKASGSKLGHTISVCETCVKRCSSSSNGITNNEESHLKEDDDDEEFHDADETDEDEDDADESDDDDDDDDDADIQVVPWSSSTAAPLPPPPPPPIPSCCSEESSSSSSISSRRRVVSTVSLPLKRVRGEKLDHHQDEEIGCSPSPLNYKEEEEAATSSSSVIYSSFRPLKDRKLAADSTSTTLISSLQRFEQKMVGSSKEETEESILAICKLSKDPRAI